MKIIILSACIPFVFACAGPTISPEKAEKDRVEAGAKAEKRIKNQSELIEVSAKIADYDAKIEEAKKKVAELEVSAPPSSLKNQDLISSIKKEIADMQFERTRLSMTRSYLELAD